MWSSASWIGAPWLWSQEEAIMEQSPIAATFLWVIKEKAHLDFTLKRHCVSDAPYTGYLRMPWKRSKECNWFVQQHGSSEACTQHPGTSLPLSAVVSFISAAHERPHELGACQGCCLWPVATAAVLHFSVDLWGWRKVRAWTMGQWAQVPHNKSIFRRFLSSLLFKINFLLVSEREREKH